MADCQQFGLSLRNHTSHFDQLFSSMLVQIDIYNMDFYFAMLPFPVVVSTRFITCLVGGPYKPSLATVATNLETLLIRTFSRKNIASAPFFSGSQIA